MKKLCCFLTIALLLTGCENDPKWRQAYREVDAADNAARARVNAAQIEAFKKREAARTAAWESAKMAEIREGRGID